MSDFILTLKKGNAKECSNYHTIPLISHTIPLISHTSKVMHKIPQARLTQYMNCELQGAQAGFRKGRETRDLIANIHWIIGKAREFQKTSTSAVLITPKDFDCVDHHKVWKIFKRGEYQTTICAS